jgi:polyphosphate kinase
MSTEGSTEAAVELDPQPVNQPPVNQEVTAVVEPTIEVVPALEPPHPAPHVIAVPNLDDSSLYIHRELSQLQFNIRVLEQALDESYPLLERLSSC